MNQLSGNKENNTMSILEAPSINFGANHGLQGQGPTTYENKLVMGDIPVGQSERGALQRAIQNLLN
jgi:hypothetical protein